MNIDRFVVYGSPPKERPLDDHKEITANSDMAAKLYATAMIADGFSVQIKDILANKFIPFGKQKEQVH